MPRKSTTKTTGLTTTKPSTPEQLVQQVGPTLLLMLLAVVRHYVPLEKTEKQQLDRLLVLLGATVALQPDAAPTATTPYTRRQQEALRESIARAADDVCNGKDEFPANVIRYLLEHSEVDDVLPQVEAPVTKPRPFRPTRPAKVRLGLLPAVKVLLTKANEKGKEIPYHSQFPDAFIQKASAWRYFEVEPRLIEYTKNLGIVLPQELRYLADILEEAQHQRPSQPPQFQRGVEWLREQSRQYAAQIDIEPEFEWCGSNVDFVEVFFVLQHSGLVKARDRNLSPGQVINKLANLCGLHISDPMNTLGERQRKGSKKSLCPTIDKLRKEYLALRHAQDSVKTKDQ